MSKCSEYFPHDYNARGDLSVVKLRMAMGWEGYGIYWGLVEKLYEAGGRIEPDFEALGHCLSVEPEKVRKVAEDFGLFYLNHNRLASHSIDRRIAKRKSIVRARKAAGSSGGKACQAIAKQLLSNSQARVKQNQAKKGKERKERKEKTPLPPADFERFWQAYPKHKDRQAALKAWARISPEAQLLDSILKAVAAQRLSQDWQKDDGKFIPYPASWLNGRRWEDEIGKVDAPVAEWKCATPDCRSKSHVTGDSLCLDCKDAAWAA